MKRRALSSIITLALCLELCPLWASAADTGTEGGLCPHHPAHTEECGYVPPVSEQGCTHDHDDDCYTTGTDCVHTHTDECRPAPDDDPGADGSVSCTHVCTEDSGCVVRTLSCSHTHDDICGYVPEEPGTPCRSACRICPIEELIGTLPSSVSADSSEQVQAQLSEIYALFEELTADEQQQVDLSPCVSLLDQIEDLGAAAQSDPPSDSSTPTQSVPWTMDSDHTFTSPYVVSKSFTVDTNGFTLTGSNSSVLQIAETGVLEIKGKVVSKKGAGIEVLSGGTLRITGAGTEIRGTTYGLDIAPGANVSLSTGTYFGKAAAIRTAEVEDLAALLAPGCAFFDSNGDLLLPADAAEVNTVIVGQCTGHPSKSYTHNAGTTTHTWTCPNCGTAEPETCTFQFDQNGDGSCICGNTVAIVVDESDLTDLVYDGTTQPDDVTITVTLTDGSNKELVKRTDYTVDYEPRKDAGEITVTVTGITFNGTFTKIYHVDQDQPVLEWDTASKPVPVAVDYDGDSVEPSDLPPVIINNLAHEDLSAHLQYSYKEQGDPTYISGLPTHAGTYDVVVSLPEMQNFEAAVSDPITLTIRKISPILTAPVAIRPVFNGSAQTLVTAGELHPAAERDGLTILFAESENGTYSTTIPTGDAAGVYDVWYRVEGTNDLDPIGPVKVADVEILRKSITPVVQLSESSYLYDGVKKEPKITVKDGTTVIEEDQYTVTWKDDSDPTATDVLKAAGTYTATIESKDTSNYTFTATAQVEIVQAVQDALHITGKPAHVYYGDTVTTLDTTGGSGNGTVEWSITAGGISSTIDPDSGVLTVMDTGSITVKAERTRPNYGPVSDTWTFTVEPKPVTAEVTVAAKVYDGTTDVADSDITATVRTGDLVGSDSITISGLTGTYEDANAGTGKRVTLGTSLATTTADPAKYTVSYPAAVQADITPRSVTVTVTLSGSDLKQETNGDYYYDYDGTAKTPNVTVTADDNAVLAASDYSVSYANNQNVGDAVVTVTAKADGNYTFADVPVDFTIKSTSAQLTSSPQAKVLTYDGTMQDLVTVGTATGGTVVYSLSQSGSYSTVIPQGKDARIYTVYYKVEGDDNHDDTLPSQVSVTISPKEIAPAVTLAQDTYVYNGSAHEPVVTVKDGTDTIDPSEYIVTYRDNTNAGTATVIIGNANGGNYIVNGTAYFQITKAFPTSTPPTAVTGLHYNGTLQELVKAGGSGEGTMVYSVDGGNYSPAVPTAAAVGTYTIDYKVLGDDNHSDTAPTSLTVTISKNTVTDPTITLSSDTFRYNGSQQKPVITVYDNNSRLIPEHEYEVTITGTNGNVGMVDVDTYTITITAPANSNYVIQGNNTRTFQILAADQDAISITGIQAQVRYGNVIQLSATGGTGIETVTWKIEDKNGSTPVSTISGAGLLTVKDVDMPLVVTVTRSRGGNYTDVSATWEFTAGKKPVTAEVTIAPKPFDGTADVTDADITATVRPDDLVSGDSITISGLKGTYDSASAGTDKTVTLNSSNVTVSGTNWEKYDITYPKTAVGSILSVAATVDTDPSAVSPLIYDASQAQELVTAGAATGGIMVYSLDDVTYAPAIPKAKDAGTYTVYFKAKGDGDHTDSAVGSVQVTIAKQTVTPQIEVMPPSAQYDGNVKRPEVIVRDGANNVIPTSEYTVIYDPAANWKDVGSHTITVQNITGGNYNITGTNATFTISTTAQAPFEIVNRPGLVHYGDTFTLSAVGGSSSSAVTWSSSDSTIAHIDADGFVTIKGTGSATITATKPGGVNYDTVTATYPLNARKKPITAIVTADDKVYDGDTSATLHVTWKDGDLVENDSITPNLTGTFADQHAGADKTVTITGTFTSDSTAQKYDITIPSTTTASIFKADAAAPVLTANARMYDGTTQALMTGGDTGTVYSDTRDGVYSATVPSGTNAGIYTVWYKERGDADHNDSAPQSIQVTISQKTLTANAANVTLSGNDLQKDTDGTYYYLYDGSDKTPSVIIMDGSATIPASEYVVSYSDNKNVGTATVTIANSADGNYIVSGTVTFKIRESGAQLVTSPQAKALTYTGQAQELVTVGTAAGGHIEYALDGGSYGKDIPKAADSGTYTVTYRVVGDDNHTDGEEGSVSVTISPKEVISPKVTVSGTYTYDGTAKEPGIADVKVEDGVNTIPSSEYALSYRDNVNAGTATVIITNANGGNYIVNGTGTFEIAKGTASAATAPTGLTSLPYNGAEQALAQAGAASNGTMVYSLSETGEYAPSIPTGKAVGTYTVWYKVQGDSNHDDSVAASVPASIIVNAVVSPTIQVKPETAAYNGEKQEPTVTVKDDNGLVIDGSEYTVAYQNEAGNSVAGPTYVGKYTLTITGTGTHYSFTATASFEILPADQTPLTITGTRERVYYGDTIQLGTEGGNGTVTWKVDNGPASIDKDTGLLTVTGVGSVTVIATSKAAGHADRTASWPFYADKKQVTAVVTAADRAYTGDTAATLTVTISSGLVSGDSITGAKAEGHFTDKNVGENKTVIIDSLTFPDDISAKYDIASLPTTTATIFKADVDETKVNAPTAKAGLEYTGLPQELVEEGSSPDGTMEYSLDGKTYSASLPAGTGAGDYEVWYRVKGDGNHNDTAGKKLADKVTIAPQEVTDPIIEFTPSNVEYDGVMHKPAVTVKDKGGRVIPESEYKVIYDSTTDWIAAKDHKVTITAKDGGNYTFDDVEATFTILPAGQGALSIVDQPGRVQYGDSFTLAVSGGTVAGAVTWTSSDPAVASIDQNGLVTVHKSGGPVTITAERAVAGYKTVTATWSFRAEKKPVTPIVTAQNKEFDGHDEARLVVTWKDGDLLNGDTIPLTLNGRFSDANVGTNKTVTITGTKPASDKYDITLPTSVTASITPKAASVTGATPTELTYDGSAQPLVTGITATNGTLAYSRNGSYYTLLVPKETDAGTYTVWYKAQADADGNYKDSPAVVVEVTIKPKKVTSPVIELSSDSFDYDGTPKRPDVVVKDGSVVIPASEYTVSYSNNTAVGTATVTITDNSNGNYDVSGSKTFTIKAGAPAVTVEPVPRDLTYKGQEQTLVTRGTAVNGHMEYSFDEYDDYDTALPKGTDAGIYEVWYKAVGDDGTETIPELVIAEILPKTVIPNITVNLASDPLQCTGSPLKPPVTVVVDNKTLTNNVDYTVTYSNNIKAGTATVTVQSVSGRNYQFSATAYFEIEKGKAEFLMKPSAIENLFYTGEPQALVTAGITQDGLVLYSTDGLNYSPIVPAKTERGDYPVIAKVQGNDIHEDSDLVVIPSVKIDRNQVQSPTVALSENSMEYTGAELKPTVTVTDKGKVIPAGEYTVSYSNNVKIGEATVTVTGNGNNYTTFTATAKFQIVDGSQPVLTITGKQDNVVYGDTLYLGTTGGTGTVTWSSNAPDVAAIDSAGMVTTKKSGSVTVTATAGSLTDTWTFTVAPKPVTAVVIAADKPYDNSTTVTLTVTFSGLVPGDIVDTVTATGHFTDASVGTNKTVIIDSLTIPPEVSAKYAITHPATTTGTITPASAKVTDAPKAATGLTYTGSPLALVTPGMADGGDLAYSLDGTSYSYRVPTAVDAGSYTVWYKAVAGDDDHKDSAVMKVEGVTIGVNTDTPTVLCTPDTFQYDTTAKTPAIVVRDSQNRIIPENEYTAELPAGRIAVGEYEVTVTDNAGGNYEFTTPVKGTFTITASSQAPLSITDKPTGIHYGDRFRLSAIGGSGGGAIQWSIAESNVATIDASGEVTVIGTGGFTVKAYRKGEDGFSDSNTDSAPFFADPKPVTPVVTAQDKPYDGNATVTLSAAWKSGDLVGSDTIDLTVSGRFTTPEAGTNKRVEITSVSPSGESGNYLITWPASTTASIQKVDAKLATPPADPGLTYNGTAQALVTSGTTVGGIGTIEYSLSQNGVYSTAIPTATNAGKYTVWFKVADSVNYTGIAAASIEVEIKKATPTISTEPTASGTEGQSLSQIKLNGGATDVLGTFAWKDGGIEPVDGSLYDVVFTPNDTANYDTVTLQITVSLQPAPSSDSDGSDSDSSTPMQTTVQNGTANTVVSAADGSKLVREAVANQSSNIVIRPEIASDVTKTQVSIPASTVDRIKSETNAALTVSAPIADVTIPHAALDTLSRAGGTVDVVTEQVDQSVVLTLTAGGETVESVPGGVTLTVPAEGAGPGTVAVLVHDDGTRETIRRSVVEDGKVNIPLNGPATVEIVDNSKDFTDVPPASWAADAVAFASSHELFSGTSETTFSPDQDMSRGMLTTVLYNLEGRPDQDLTGQDLMSGFDDVSSDAWYADGIAWAAENGITGGYGDGRFGPNDSITREQFVVMLWKYAGAPEASGQTLTFTDSDQASGYALEALCWAVENGILNGYTDGQLAPGGTATRAQAAQMLKNFLENT